MASLRSLRSADFRRRAEYSPELVYRHRISGWEFIPIHPFADEPELLVRLKLKPEDCWSADAWWKIGGDATLLQSCISRLASRAPGFYAQRTQNDQQWIYLMVVVDAPNMTRIAFESAMTRFVDLGFP